MPGAPARGAGTATRGAGTAGRGQGAQVAKFLHSQGNTRDQVHAQLRRNGHSDAEATRITRDEFEPPKEDTGPASTPPQKATGNPPAARSGRTPAKPRAARRGSIGAGPVRVTTPGTAGGLLLALVTYPVFIAWVRGGNPAVTAWFKAKFLNQTSSSGTSRSAGGETYGGTSGVTGTPGTPGFNPKAGPRPGQPFYPYDGTGTGTGA